MYHNNNYGSQHQQTYQTLSGLSTGVATSTAGSTWNGSAWVNNNITSHTTPSIPPPSGELPRIPPHMQGTMDTNTAPASRLVTFYSEVYAYWSGQVTACKTSGDTSSTAYTWAAYYSDLSSRAAHYYNNIVQNPPPIASNSENKSQSRFAPKVTSQPQTAPAPAPSSTQGPPKSFNGYAHRCLSQCTTESQKNSMKEMVEMTIRKALQNGYMHDKNWNVEPLLPLYQDTKKNNDTDTAASGKSYANAVSNSFSNQGQSQSSSLSARELNSNSNRKRSSASLEQDLPDNDSYYGSSPTRTSKKSKKAKKNNGQNLAGNDSYYGSSTTSTFDGDFIALSSLSSDRYVKTKNKLVKVSKKKKKKQKDGFDATANTLASRADRFSGQGGIVAASSNGVHAGYKQDIDRYMGKTVIGGNSKGKLGEEEYEKMTVKGTSRVLEKSFLRLTAPPKSELVRPQPILEKHLANITKLRKKIRTGKIAPDKGKDYDWFCSQLKAIRQDLRVQRIFNAFAVKAYETHARIALEEGDVNEYNQSQTQLKDLYEQISYQQGKDSTEKSKGLKNQNEFIAYRIIYHVLLTGNKKYEGGSTDLFKIMLNLTVEQRDDPYIAHALKVRIAVADNDYHAFFRLQDDCPNHGAYLMDLMLPQIRAIGLKNMMKAYRPSVDADFVLVELGFSFNGELNLREGIAWLKGCGCRFTEDERLILAKDTVLDDSFLAGDKKSSLI